jgi:Alkylmercury lyase
MIRQNVEPFDLIESRRVDIYEQLAREGRVDHHVALAARWGTSAPAAADILSELASARHVVLDVEGEIELAHPFGTRDFGFSVKSTNVLWWGGCAWDAFAIPHLVPGSSPALVATTCPGCGTAHAWNVRDDTPTVGTQLVHFLVPIPHVWDDVIHASENQRIFCDGKCLDAWLDLHGQTRGFTFDIEALWNLSAEWYAGRLERGYRRREPSEAADYFRGVGLVGTFWGNAD